MRGVTLWLLAALCFVQDSSQSIIRLNRDFSNVAKDNALAAHVRGVVQRLETFKVPVHPRIRMFYGLLKKGITDHVHRTSDTLFKLDKYNTYDDNRA